MILTLKRLPPIVRGIYGPGKDQMAARMLYLHPSAVPSFAALGGDSGRLAFSDIFRSADASLQAVEDKRGAQPPGYSAHNYGLAFDLAVDETLGLRHLTYSALLEELAASGWYCYRRDGRRGSEDWHFNHLGDAAKDVLAKLTSDHATWPHAAESSIQCWYGDQLSLNPAAAQAALRKLGLYGGGIDGRVGPLTRRAAAAFAKAWELKTNDLTDVRFQRTLAYVAADKDITD